MKDFEKLGTRRGRSASLAGRLEKPKGLLKEVLQPQFKAVGGRKRQQTKNSGEDSQPGCKENSEISKEETTPAWHKQTFEDVAASKKARKKSLTRCDLGDSCVACNSTECGNCKHCLDK